MFILSHGTKEASSEGTLSSIGAMGVMGEERDLFQAKLDTLENKSVKECTESCYQKADKQLNINHRKLCGNLVNELPELRGKLLSQLVQIAKYCLLMK